MKRHLEIYAVMLTLIIGVVSVGVFLADPEQHPYEAVLDGMAFLGMSISATCIIILGLLLLSFGCAKFFSWLVRQQTLWRQIVKEFFGGICYSVFLIALVFGAITYSEAGQQLVNLPLTSDLTDTKGNLTAGGLIRNSDATYVNTAGTLAYSRGTRTNLLTQSTTFGDYTTFNVSLSAGQTTAPDGTLTGYKITVTTASFAAVRVSYLKTAGVTVCYSVYMKAGNKDSAALRIDGGSFVAGIYSGPGSISGSSGNASITGLSSTSWTRVYMVGTFAASGWASSFQIYPYGSTGQTIGDYVYFWGPQVEQLPSGNVIGSDLMDAGAGVFTSGTYGWAVYGTNTIANVSNTLEVTYVDDAKGAQLALSAASDLSANLTVGETYQISLDSMVNAGSVTVEVRDTSDAVLASYAETETSLTTRTLYFKATHASTNKLSFAGMAAGEVVTIDNLTIKSVPDLSYIYPGAYTATSGSTATIPAEPRFETNGLLVEGEATNYVTYSCDFTNAAWVKSNITPLKNQTGPDGTANAASLLTAGAANGTALFTVADGGTATNKTFSVWLKRVTGTGNIDLTDNNGTNWTTQSVTSTWTKFALAARSQAIPIVGIRIVANTDAVAVCLAQSEISAFATSPIPTNGCPVTRLTEAGSTTNGYSWTMSAALKAAATDSGTMILEVMPGHAAAGGTGTGSGIVSLTNAATSFLYYDYTNTNFEATDGTNTAENDETIANATTYTVAVRWDQDANSGDGYLKVSEKHSGTWTHGTAVNFNDAYAAGDYLRLAYGNEYPFWIKNIRFYDGWIKDANLDAPKARMLFPILPFFGGVKAYQY